MQYYQHEFDNIEDYLHHRTPYLMIDRLVSVDDHSVVTQKDLTGDEFFMPGHFPGAPILPGAMMQEMTTQSAGIMIAARYNPMQRYNTSDPLFNEFALGVLVKVKQSRFRGFARPGDKLQVSVSLTEKISEVFEFSGAVAANGKTIMRNRFQLTNIPSKTLQGVSA